MICYAVIDTNVLVSALLSGKDDSATVQIIEKVILGDIIPIYSTHIITEYKEVLSRDKFGFSSNVIDYLLSAIIKYGFSINPVSSKIAIPDIKDLPFYDAALEKSKDGAYLVTGNLKHFPSEPFIVSPRELLELLN